VDSVATTALEEGPGAGLTIGIVRGADTLVWRGYGKANVELDVPAGPATVYRIGSVTKQFTAALVLRKVEAGRLSLDDPLAKYVPDYDTHGKTVTLRELLRHTAGVPNYTSNPDFWKQSRLDLPATEVLAMGHRDSLDFAPGTHWSYSNTGYYLLGLVLEKVTGRPYDELVNDSLAAPLGLEHTRYCWGQPLIPGRAEGYAATDSVRRQGKLAQRVLVNAEPLSMGPPFAAGALCSTSGDLVKWTRLLHGGKVVSPAAFRLMTTPDTLPNGLSTHYGFALFLGDLGGHRSVWHGGGINGFLTSLARYPDDDLTVVVLSNSTSVSPDALQQEIASFVLGVPAPDTEAHPLPREVAARVAGTYELVDRTVVNISMAADSLTATMGTEKPMTLRYEGGGTGKAVFGVGPRPGMRLVFQAPAQRMELHQGIVEFDALRVSQ
jgi:CubicO group peptidase (beta-lactamase class C family)